MCLRIPSDPDAPATQTGWACASRLRLRGWPFSKTSRGEITLSNGKEQDLSRRYAAQDQRLRDLLGFDVDAYIDEYVDARAGWRQSEEAREARRGLRAMALAPTLALYEALLAGERIPWTELEFLQAKRFGLSRAPADGRVCLDDFNEWPR